MGNDSAYRNRALDGTPNIPVFLFVILSEAAAQSKDLLDQPGRSFDFIPLLFTPLRMTKNKRLVPPAILRCMTYDCIIIGGGPAALAAAIYFARQKTSFLMIAGTIGGKTLWSSDVENYLGFHLISGVDLVKKFEQHVADYQDQFTLKRDEYVHEVVTELTGFRIHTDKGVYASRMLLVATGQENRKLNVPGETELYGHGLTYCATCDGPLYRDKQVHVIGGGNSAMDAALLLEKIRRASNDHCA
jgi:alkyl hydroperoxide reductase subunit AhpF